MPDEASGGVAGTSVGSMAVSRGSDVSNGRGGHVGNGRGLNDPKPQIQPLGCATP